MTKNIIESGIFNLGSLGGDGASTTRPTRRWGGITGRSLVTSGGNVPTTGVLSLAEMLQASYAPNVYTFELWGAGGGGGGPHNSAALNTEHSGPGGGGAYVAGTLVNLTAGTTLQLLAGGAGLGGSKGGNDVASSGAGGGASAIRLGSTVIAVAGGGGGGGGAGATAAADATGGRGGNSLAGGNVNATDVSSNGAGFGGQSGNATAAGDGPNTDNRTNPPAKTDSLQNGGDGREKDSNTVGNGQSATPHPAGWGGAGGDGALTTGGEGGGGAGGGGWFGGSGGDGAEGGSESGAGGGGGGSYYNATYVVNDASLVSAEGSFESSTAHGALAVTQPSLGTQTATPRGKGGNGAGGNGAASIVNGSDGESGGVYIYKNGILVASVTASTGTPVTAGTTTYTLQL